MRQCLLTRPTPRGTARLVLFVKNPSVGDVVHSHGDDWSVSEVYSFIRVRAGGNRNQIFGVDHGGATGIRYSPLPE